MKAIIDYQALLKLRLAAAGARGTLTGLQDIYHLDAVTEVIKELESALENARDYEVES